MASFLFGQTLAQCFQQLVETPHGLDLFPLFFGEIFFGELLQPFSRNLGLDRAIERFQPFEHVAEHAIELVEVALVFHQRRARQVIKILHPARGQVGVHGLHQREIFAQRHRNAGAFEFGEECNEHARQFALARVSVKRVTLRSGPGNSFMYLRDNAFLPRWIAAGGSWLLLQAPALWNGFPLLQYDTGGYLARWYEGTLVPSRAVVYGLMLNAGAPAAFWPVVAAQAALTVWIIALVLRAHGFGGRPWLLLVVVTTLTVLSTLPWLTSILLTDIFAGLGILALYLLLLRPGRLSRNERFALTLLIAVCVATHSATMAVLVTLVVTAIFLWLAKPHRVPLARIGNGVLALALGTVFVFAADFVVARRLAWTPGGFALSFGR